MRNIYRRIFSSIAVIFTLSALSFAQSTEFTYQGRLLDNNLPMTAVYDFEFSLWNSLANGTQQGTTQTVSGVAVSNGIFTVRLNFGAQFDGSSRFLQIAVRASGGGAYSTLAPRQAITSGPYAIRSLNSTTADTATNSLQLGGVAANQYVVTTDPRMTNERNPLPNSGNYIWNQSAVQQPSSNFVISGNGDVGGTLAANVVRATTQYNIGGARVLSAAGTDNIFAGIGAGSANATGSQNSFFGRDAGLSNSSGDDNSFFGRGAGAANAMTSNNSYFGRDAGLFTTGSGNSYFGRSAGRSSSGGDNSFFGREAGLSSSGSANSFFGRSAGAANSASDNSFFGTYAGESNTSGTDNSFFGRSAGNLNTTASFNSFFGRSSGRANTGSSNSFFGYHAGEINTTGDNNSFFGHSAGINNREGSSNSFFGSGAGFGHASLGAGTANSFFGRDTGRTNRGNDNSFFGESAGESNTTGDDNSFFGRFAGTSNSSGGNNSFFGHSAGFNNSGGNNSFFGHSAGLSNGNGVFNSFFGTLAGSTNTSGNFNTMIGYNTDLLFEDLSYATAIGAGAVVSNSNTVVLGRPLGQDLVRVPGAFETLGGTDAEPIGGGYIVVGPSTSANLAIDTNEIMARNNGATATLALNADGGNVNLIQAGTGNVGIGTASPQDKLHVDGIIRASSFGQGGSLFLCRNAFNQISDCSSSLRYKTNINRFGLGLKLINQLKPITFDWKDDGMRDLGLGAEDVAAIEPLLVTYNKNGEVEGVKYDRIAVIAVNAIKEQQEVIGSQQSAISGQKRQIDELRSKVEAQQKQIDALTKLICAQNSNSEICKEEK